MAQTPSHFQFTCLNPDCGKKLRLPIPKKSGIYTITCPHCGTVKKMRLKGLDVLCPPAGEAKPASQAQPAGQPAPKPAAAAQAAPAPKPTQPINVTGQLQPYRGKLTLLRRGWLNKDYPLRDGRNVIGRYDEAKVSDIAIKGDSSMSRQSVEIAVEHQTSGYSFKLTVKNAANPVLHNGKPLPKGDSVSLNFGDSIVLGKTKFRFDKEA